MIPLHVRSPDTPFQRPWSHRKLPSLSSIYRFSTTRPLYHYIVLLFVLIVWFLWPGESLWGYGGKTKDGYPSYTKWPPKMRSEAVKEAFVHAYGAYEEHAMPADEYMPLSNRSQQNFNGWGVSMYDALDTIVMMDLQDEFERAMKYISVATFHQENSQSAMFFETVIRYLGGLLSAYTLSGRDELLRKADELGGKLMPIFNTPTGMPAYGVNTITGSINFGTRPPGEVIIAEFASFQMEYKYLAYLTGKTEYFSVAERVNNVLEKSQSSNGLWYTTWNTSSGSMMDQHITIGAWADSAYEYLLKQYLVSGKREKKLRDMYLKAASGIIRNLLYLSPRRSILYVTDKRKGSPTHSFEHLSCFLPGLFALGASELKTEMDPQEWQLHMWAAEGLAHSCWLMYADQESGLGPEEVIFLTRSHEEYDRTFDSANASPSGGGRSILWVNEVTRWQQGGSRGGKPPGVKLLAKPLSKGAHNYREKDYILKNEKYLLRPETIESLYIMWRTTRDEAWRDRAWQIFLAIEAHCRIRRGYTSVNGVGRPLRQPEFDTITRLDDMPSYALAETWKYLYLTFLDNDPFPQDKFVFNTEAHPFSVFHYNDK